MPSMLIENVFPEVVADKSTLPERLAAEGASREMPQDQIVLLLSIVPPSIAQAGAFLDKMTGLWRYEFGVPYQLGGSLVWGTHMWEQVDRLFEALHSVLMRVPESKRSNYLQLLGDSGKHQQTLVEMIPAIKVSHEIPMDFEVAGLGNGNRTLDWVIGPYDGRMVLCDVKRRTRDFLEQFEQMGDSPVAPEPAHDPSLLFRNVEQKFVPNDPALRLQGAWIVTDIAQNEELLLQAFSALDGERVHFAVLGDWEADAHFLVRREEDRCYLHSLFRTADSSRFVFCMEADVEAG